MKSANAPFFAVVICATTAQAGTLCDRISGVLDHTIPAASGLSHDLLGDPTQCRTTLSMNGQTSLNCNWTFGFRADEATAAFEHLSNDVSECLQVADSQGDQPVSHPDSYDLRVFRSFFGEVGVSLKDKGAIQQTLVFLRITPDP